MLLVAAAVLAAVGATPLLAQTTASLTGRVTAQGRPVGDAQIGITDKETNQVRGTRTSATGDYTIVGLQPGTYVVRVQRVGFTPGSREIRMLFGQRATLDFELQETAVTLSGVQVTAEPRATFEAQRTDISAPVVQAEIQNLPLNTPQHDQPCGDRAGYQDVRADRGSFPSRRRTAAGSAVLELLPRRRRVEIDVQRQSRWHPPDWLADSAGSAA